MFTQHIMLTSGHLRPFENLIGESVDIALQKIIALIPVDNIDVIIFEQRDDGYNPSQVDPEIGLGQYAVSSHIIYIAVDAKHKNIEENIKGEKLHRVLAHAMYHCIRGRSMYWSRGPLLEAFIAEGLAGHFEEEVTHVPVSPVYRTVTGEMLESFRKRAEKSYWDKQYNWGKWFLGQDQAIPYGYGHALGYHLVEEYLKIHPDESSSKLYSKQPQEFIK